MLKFYNIESRLYKFAYEYKYMKMRLQANVVLMPKSAKGYLSYLLPEVSFSYIYTHIKLHMRSLVSKGAIFMFFKYIS